MTPSTPDNSVQPYLFFNGRCDEALEFYRAAVGAEVEMLSRFKDSPEPQPGLPDNFGDKVMHASFRVGDSILMASDGRGEGEPKFEGFSLSLTWSRMRPRPNVFSPHSAKAEP